jgi:two-component system response regulator YesN
MEMKMKEFNCIIVDDDKWALIDIRKSLDLEKAGFRVVGEYLNADDALQAIKHLKPDLVITDICMGKKSGLEMIQACREHNIFTEFIIISGYSEFAYAQRALKYNVFYYMLKPIEAQEGKRVMHMVYEKLAHGRYNCAVEEHSPFENVLEYIRENFAEDILLEELAKRFGFNMTYLSSLFKKKTGKSFVQYKNEVKVEKAKVFLRNSNLSIHDIAIKCGVDDASYFSFIFKQLTGVSPTQYRSGS